jgi:hypothetical protein
MEEIKTFVSVRNIGVMLLPETRFTEKSYPNLSNYAVCNNQLLL